MYRCVSTFLCVVVVIVANVIVLGTSVGQFARTDRTLIGAAAAAAATASTAALDAIDVVIVGVVVVVVVAVVIVMVYI